VRGARIILALAVPVAAVLVIGPWIAGMKCESLVRDELADGAVGPVRVQGVDYARGWWTSTLHTTLAVGDGPAFTVTHVLRHGPLDYDALLAGRLGEVFVLAAIDAQEPAPGALRATIGFNGDTHILGFIRHGRLRTTPGTEIAIGALDADISCPAGDAPCTGRISARALRLRGDTGTLGARELALQLEGPAPGAASQHWLVTGLELARADGAVPASRVGEARIEYDTTVAGGRLGARLDARLSRLQIGGWRAGSATLAVTAERVAVEALPELRAALARYVLARERPGTSTRALLAVWQALGPVLQARPELHLQQLEVATGNGTLRGAGSLRVRAQALDADPLSLLDAVEASLSLRVPAPIVDAPFAEAVRDELAGLEPGGKVPGLTAAQRDRAVAATARERAREWAAAHHLRREDGEYRLDARLANGVVRVNGAPLEFRP